MVFLICLIATFTAVHGSFMMLYFKIRISSQKHLT